jgi:hypothetical protein
MSRTGVVVLATVLGLGGCTSGDSGGPTPPICPTVLPEMGGACAPAGAACRYARSANSCDLACACLGGSWNCEPACVPVLVADATVPVEDAAADGESDAGKLVAATVDAIPDGDTGDGG